MPGGIIVLVANGTGPETIILTNNPQFSYFKSVFRRYTNFATEPIEVPFSGGTTSLPLDKGITLKCTIPRHAELMSHLYLKVDLPAIYSGVSPCPNADGDPDPNDIYGLRFQWIRDLGSRLIEEITLTIGGVQVQKLTGEWIALWYKMFAPEEVDLDIWNDMTGNTPEYYDPANAPHAMGVYPTSTLLSTDTTDPELSTTNLTPTITNPNNRTASIPKKTLHIPIPFWFSAHSGAALPLVALQNNEVEVQVTLRPLQDIYTVQDPTTGKQIPPNANQPEHAISSFQSVSDYEALQGSSAEPPADLRLLPISTRLDLNPRLLASYVFLDDQEQAQFAASTHRYLIEQIDYRYHKGIRGPYSFDLTLNHPVKTIVWCAQREDVSCRNDWSNYTNNTTPGGLIPSTSLQAYRPLQDEQVFKVIDPTPPLLPANNQLLSGFVSRVPTSLGLLSSMVTRYDYPNTEQDILQNATLLFNGIELFCTQESSYFGSLQPLQCRQRKSPPGVYSYSYALNPRVVRQPSGACDTSRVTKVQLNVTALDATVVTDEGVSTQPEYTLNVFVVQYNVLRIMGGMGGVEYAN